MHLNPFQAFLIQRQGDTCAGQWTEVNAEILDPGDVTIRVHYSSVNYKDALAATGAGKIIRRFPRIGGIDLAGEVVACSTGRFQIGAKVIATSYDIGVAHHGGYAQFARVPSDWVVPLPAAMSPLEAMSLGTAGLTAALAICRMEDNGLAPGQGPVVVNGATGGVGSLAIMMLQQLGHEVVAVTSKEDETQRLLDVGATEVILAKTLNTEKSRAMEKARWSGGIDNLGGNALHWMLATTKQAGVVASVGNAASADLITTVFPFILRGVSLLGVDSGFASLEVRSRVWNRLASDLKLEQLESVVKVITPEGLHCAFEDHLHARSIGRTVLKMI